jgi:hypothetical protein
MCRSGQLEKKVADNRPGVPLPFPLYIEAPFSMSADSTTDHPGPRFSNTRDHHVFPRFLPFKVQMREPRAAQLATFVKSGDESPAKLLSELVLSFNNEWLN